MSELSAHVPSPGDGDTCKCCGKVVAPGCLVCTYCAVTDPEGPSLLAAEREVAVDE